MNNTQVPTNTGYTPGKTRVTKGRAIQYHPTARPEALIDRPSGLPGQIYLHMECNMNRNDLHDFGRTVFSHALGHFIGALAVLVCLILLVLLCPALRELIALLH